MTEERLRKEENNRLVRNLIDIKHRQTRYKDILDRHKDGHNIYSLQGNYRDAGHSGQTSPQKERKLLMST